MDLLDLSRFQFAFTAIIHFIFVPLTLGLSVFIAIIKTIAYKNKDPKYDKLAMFLMKLFAVNFAAGVATGLTMEFEFGTNWFTYSKFVGDIFGAPLAIEGLMAFFLESTFIGLFLFGKDRLSDGMHTFSAWMVALGSNLSALWILIANSWMQTPAGYHIVSTPQGIRAELTNFWAAVINHTTVARLLHTVTAGQITAGFFVMGVMAYFLLRNKNVETAKIGLKAALIFTTVVSIFEIVVGDIAGHLVAEYQPLKLAMMEGKWQTEQPASLDVFGYVDQSNKKTYPFIQIPGLLSFLAYHNFDAKVYGIGDLIKMYDQKAQNYADQAKALEAQNSTDPKVLQEIAADKAKAKAYNISNKDLPQMNLVFMPFHIMVDLGFFFAFVALWGLYLLKSNKIYTNKAFLKTVLYSIPLPFIGSELGWMTAEIGRQPWIVTGVLKTADAVSFNATSNVLFSVITFITIYLLLFYVYITTMIKKVKEYQEEESTPSTSPSGSIPNVALNATKTDLDNNNRIS